MSLPPRTPDEVLQRIEDNPVSGSPEAMRSTFARLAGPGPEGEARRIGIDGRVYGAGPVAAVWLHGGGYVFGSARTHAATADALAQALGAAVFVPDYRLAPENPWPAMLEDALSVLDALEGPVLLCGDSAGGHLALNAALARGGRVLGLALVSSNTDRTGQSVTRARNTPHDAMNSDEDDASLGQMAFAGRDPADPQVSPLLADLTGLPPVWLTASTEEVLLDDTLLLARALGLAGVPVQLRLRRGLMHMWTLWPEAMPEARETMADIAGFAAGLRG
ncbi:alpha/beta hydrolase fold domain-containing protein [Pseudoroseicyclus aestuarii]|uniref:Acetyl esterase/lipase n=1 Tax=Pseudoroseicyclus aestuarii TaxID=1795041 RepID=A0A318SV98_9RHOB|nr:alpha/beta hydrolase fold domain-containing protein [Pseudoroseicyclus aestuarii]PYE83787.1 acetyl esterase/lipase [Pseudoroseicyclus aestuarii]